MNAIGIAAASYGVIMALSPVLQISRMVKNRSSEDVSIGYFLVLTVGFFLWIAYGISESNAVLVIPNTCAATVSLATLAVAFRYRSTEGSGT